MGTVNCSEVCQLVDAGRSRHLGRECAYQAVRVFTREQQAIMDAYYAQKFDDEGRPIDDEEE